jgi:hypothetical protein
LGAIMNSTRFLTEGTVLLAALAVPENAQVE